MVDVEPMGRQDDARGIHARIGLADDDDRVRRFLEREAVGGTELGGVGQGGVAREELVRDAQARDGLIEPGALGVVVHADNGSGIGACGARPSSHPAGTAAVRRRC